MSMSKPCALCAYENNGWGEQPCATCGPDNPHYTPKLLGVKKALDEAEPGEVVYIPKGVDPAKIEASPVAVRFDSGKPKMSRVPRDFLMSLAAACGEDEEFRKNLELVPMELLKATVRVLAFGAKKYAPRNWEKGFDWDRVYDSLQRHLTAWWDGEDTDPESGLSHIDHAAANMAFLTAHTARGIGTDTRASLKE